MANNEGKIFEEQFRRSAPDYVILHRLRDSSQSFSGGELSKFSVKNPFDYILWDSKAHILYALELKSTKSDRIQFERKGDRKRNGIHWHQIDALNKWNQFDGVIGGIIIEFRQIGKVIFIHIDDFNKLSDTIDSVGFRISDLEKHNIPYTVIDRRFAKTKYKYDIDKFLTNSSI